MQRERVHVTSRGKSPWHRARLTLYIRTYDNQPHTAHFAMVSVVCEKIWTWQNDAGTGLLLAISSSTGSPLVLVKLCVPQVHTPAGSAKVSRQSFARCYGWTTKARACTGETMRANTTIMAKHIQSQPASHVPQNVYNIYFQFQKWKSLPFSSWQE
jgi:hypothetical protein